MATTAISEVLICNMGLSLIGAGKIESLTEGTAESNECDTWYTFSRRQALAAHDWSFARKHLTLADHTDDPDDTWAFRYQYPSDCVVMRKLQSPTSAIDDAIPFEVELDTGGDALSILTDLDDAIAIYTRNLTNVALFSEFFVVMLATAIASNVAFALTGKEELKKDMVEQFLQMSSAARATNANEQVGRAPREADYIRGR